MATRVGDALGLAQCITLPWGQLGQAVSPARQRAVRAAGVDQQGAGVGHQRSGLACGGVGQAQEGHVGGVEQPRPLGAVFAALRGDAQHFDIAAPRQHLVDAKAGGAFLSVNEDEGAHGAIRLVKIGVNPRG